MLSNRQTPRLACFWAARGTKPRLRAGRSLLLVIALLWAGTSLGFAAQASVTLTWDNNPEPGVVGYVAYYGTRSGSHPFSIPAQGGTSVRIPRLKEGRTYYFTVAAVTWIGLESEPSEEIPFTIPSPCLDDRVKLSLTPPASGEGGVKVSFPAAPGAKYQVLVSEDLHTWTPAWTSPIAPATEPASLEFMDIPSTGWRFYRSRILGQFTESKRPLVVTPNEPDGSAIRFSGAYGTIYELQSSSDGTNWESLWNSPAGTVGEFQVNDPRPDQSASRRYRLMASPELTGPYWDPCGPSTNEPPTIPSLPNLEIYLEETYGPIAFSVEDVDTPPGVLHVTVTSSDPSVIPNETLELSHHGADYSLLITPAGGASGVTSLTVAVTDGDSVTESVFDVEVLPYTQGSSRPAIRTYGLGSVRPDVDGRELVIGKRYTLTAVPAPGQVFLGWTGRFTSSSPKLTFVMEPEFLLEAYFGPSPFLATKGVYQGLIERASGEVPDDPAREGSITVTVTEKGSYSGKLMLGGQRHSFSGQLTLDRTATNLISRLTGLPLELELAFGADSSEPMHGRLAGGIPEATLLAYGSGYDAKTHPAPSQGIYTIVFPGQTDGSVSPQGAGVASLKINGSGSLTLAGTLADGTKVSQKVSISKDGFWPLSIPLRSGQGLLQGWLTVSNDLPNGISGNAHWLSLPGIKTKYYPAGFTNQLQVLGGRYTRPAATDRILPLALTSVSFQGGNLTSSFTNLILLREGSRVENASANPLTLSFSLANGLFKGTVVEPGSTKSYRYNGAVLQDHGVGWGQLLGTNRSASVTLGF